MNVRSTGEKVKVQPDNRIYLNEKIRRQAGIHSGQEYEIFLTDQRGIFILKRLVAGELTGD